MKLSKLTKKRSWNYQNLKITGELLTPLFLNDKLNFDSIVFFAMIRYYCGSEYYNFGNSTIFGNDKIILPLLKKGNVWASSIGEYKSYEFIQQYRKRYNEISIDNWCEPKKIVTRKGKYKNHDRPMILTNSSQIVFYCIGDKKELVKILKMVQAIGKKQSQGFGLIKQWIIEEVDRDVKIYRSIQCTESDATSFGCIAPPYFSKDMYYYKFDILG